MKSYTDIEQSHELADILPLESADCFWDYDELQKYHRISWFEDGYEKDSQLRLNENNVCAWSLAALLNILPNYHITNNGITGVVVWSMDIYSKEHPNLIDACVEMILKLHKLNLL